MITVIRKDSDSDIGIRIIVEQYVCDPLYRPIYFV